MHIGRIAEAAVHTVEVAGHKKALAGCSNPGLTSGYSRSCCFPPMDLGVDIGSFSLRCDEVVMLLFLFVTRQVARRLRVSRNCRKECNQI